MIQSRMQRKSPEGDLWSTIRGYPSLDSRSRIVEQQECPECHHIVNIRVVTTIRNGLAFYEPHIDEVRKWKDPRHTLLCKLSYRKTDLSDPSKVIEEIAK